MSKSKRNHQENTQRTGRAALERVPANQQKYKESSSEMSSSLGSNMSDKARQALENIRRQSVSTLQGAELYPVVPTVLPPLLAHHVDGVDMVNLGNQSTSDFGIALGMGNRSPFRDPITQTEVQSLSNYWTYLMDGGGDKSILAKPPTRSVDSQPYTKNFYALFAFAVYCKFTSNEDFRTILTLPEMPRFDYFRLDNNQRRRMRSSAHIVGIYENLRNAFMHDEPFDFFVWLDKDSFIQYEDQIRALKNEDEALTLIVSILAETEQYNSEKWNERRKQRQAAQGAQQAAKPRKQEAKPARGPREDRQPPEGAHARTAQGSELPRKDGFQGKGKKGQPRNVADVLKEQARAPAPVAVPAAPVAPLPDAPLEAPVIPENTTAAPHVDTVIPAETLVSDEAQGNAPVVNEPPVDVADDKEDGQVIVLNGFTNSSSAGTL